MGDNNYGVYISIRNTEGVLVSSSRATAEEVREDLPGLLSILAECADGPEPAAAEPVTSGYLPVAGGTTMGPEQVQYELNKPVVPPFVAPAAPTGGQFESCPKCHQGTKDKWVPPGISRKSGKHYPGFFGCNNPNCR